MDELRNLYQELIVDHNRKPRNYRVMEHPSHLARGNNPLCGDKVVVFLHVEGGPRQRFCLSTVGSSVKRMLSKWRTPPPEN